MRPASHSRDKKEGTGGVRGQKTKERGKERRRTVDATYLVMRSETSIGGYCEVHARCTAETK